MKTRNYSPARKLVKFYLVGINASWADFEVALDKALSNFSNDKTIYWKFTPSSDAYVAFINIARRNGYTK